MISSINPRMSIFWPSARGPKAVTSPDVPMPPMQPVASTSSTFAPSRAALMAAASAGRTAARHYQVVTFQNRNLAYEFVGTGAGSLRGSPTAGTRRRHHRSTPTAPNMDLLVIRDIQPSVRSCRPGDAVLDAPLPTSSVGQGRERFV